jgi:RHS repeat-associated protein
MQSILQDWKLAKNNILRSATSATKQTAVAGVIGMAWLISGSPAQADNIAYYYYAGTEISGVVAWDSTTSAPAVINGVTQISLFGGGQSFNAYGSGGLDINSSGQVADWDLQSYYEFAGGLYAMAAITNSSGHPAEAYEWLGPQPAPFPNYQNSNATGSWSAGKPLAQAPIAKGLGNPSPPATPATLPSSAANPIVVADLGCPATPSGTIPDPVPNADCGEPINAAIGNTFETETDFTGAPVTGLALTRYYNSQDPSSSAFGTGWHSVWHRSLTSLPPNAAIVTRADGREDTFQLVNGVWQADPDVTSVLTPFPAAGTQTGWQVVTADDTTETYTLAGQLTSITSRAGLTTTLTYNGSGQLTTVTGPFGDALKFTSDAQGRVSTMTVPDGGVFTYGYDANNNLISVTHPDASVRKYLYGITAFPNALTGITDENGSPFASWTYDTQGRAITSQHAGGADLTTVTYNAAGTSTATDADGNAHTYTLTTLFNVVKPTALSGAVYPPAGGQAFIYDVNGFPASKTDFNGNVTAYTHDTRGDQTSRVEASGSAVARTISTAWLANFHLPSSITEPGRVTGFSYDAKGDLLKKTITAGALARSWTYTYNADGQALTATDPLGHVTTYTYDATGDIATIKDPLGHVTTFTGYDLDGRPTGFTDPNGLTTKLAYNFRGEVTSRTVGSEVTTYSYDLAGQLKKITLPDASSYTFTYDPAHRLTGVADALGNHVTYTYDPASNETLAQVFNASNVLMRKQGYGYDTSNRLAQIIGALGQTTALGRDPNGNITSVTDPLGNATAYGIDALNRIAQMTDPKGGVTTFGLDPLDHLTSVTDPRGLVTAYGWNGLDEQTSVSSPDTGAITRSFDLAGNVLTSTDARGFKTSYTYDALNRPTKRTFADGTAATMTYDTGTYGIGHLSSVTDPSGTTGFAYDQHGRVSAQAQTISGKALNTAWSFSATTGQLASMTYPSGGVETLSYDGAGRVSALKLGAATLISGITYMPFGPVAGWTQGNGGVYARSFDQDERIAGITLGNGNKMTFGRDNADNITGITETGQSNQTIGYDPLNRVASYVSGATSQGFVYDLNGNRTSLTGTGATNYSIAAASNRLVSATGTGARTITPDADGNTLTDSKPLTVLGYAYDKTDPLGRMTQAKTGAQATSYTNNAFGERVTRSGYGAAALPGSAERMVYDPGRSPLGEYGVTTGTPVQETVWLPDPAAGQALPVAVSMPPVSATPFYVSPDQIGAPHQVTNSVRTSVWSWPHDPFGNGNPSGSVTYSLRFPGQMANSETSLFNNGFRDYDPSIGRYVQSDPIGLGGGVNTYGYVGQNPVTRGDPLGLWQVTTSFGYGPGGIATFGYNGGQWNVGAYFGVGAGASVSFDPNDSSCNTAGGVFGVRGEGEFRVGPYNGGASAFVGNYAYSYAPYTSSQIALPFLGTPLSFIPWNTEGGQIIPPPTKPTITFGGSAVAGGGGTYYFPPSP